MTSLYCRLSESGITAEMTYLDEKKKSHRDRKKIREYGKLRATGVSERRPCYRSMI
jgi:hypothetical protein